MIIHILDDDITILDAASFLLKQLGYQIKTWSNSQDFIEYADLFQPGILLLDMKMPLIDGHQVHKYLNQQHSTLAVIIITGHGDVSMAVQELKQGAVDFLQKPVKFEELQSVLKIAKQKTLQKYEYFQIKNDYASLSQKELEILQLLLQGYINRKIAEELNISVRTVEVHRSHLMQKMHAKTLAELIYKIANLTEP